MRFSRLSNDEELGAYLREFTLRNDEERNTLFLSHYSSISKALNNLKSGYLWLGDYRQMNDPSFSQGIRRFYHLMVEIVLFMVFTDRVQITMRILVRGEMQII